MHLLKSAGMELQKWSSNNPVLLQKVPMLDREYNFDNPNSATLKTLGLQFNPEKDTFSFSVQKMVSPATKRTILSDVYRLFDPLSLLGPLIITVKMFLQKLWILRFDWTDEVPLHLNREWEKFSPELSQLKNLNVERHVLYFEALKVDLTGFGDASKNAYGCAVYTRFVKNLKRAVKTAGPLNAEELNYAETFLIKNVQIQAFAKDISSLQKHHCGPPGSSLDIDPGATNMLDIKLSIIILFGTWEVFALLLYSTTATAQLVHCIRLL
ncbi:hypothetical protein HNY73_015591 [Argiope bruennichi]|uniref:Uncharacterized protein n=1 Tax=Argiope bruennichi TaxID=94029 RepID=A0A8T0EX14_ARGBR|nr:hypothetical protein HNY73_015591 [Argiope bruennichi]